MHAFMKLSFTVFVLGCSSLLLSSFFATKEEQRAEQERGKTPEPKYMPVPHFVRSDLNTIQYPEYLEAFREKMRELERGERQQVRILHIGDSHIQAGHAPRRLMELLHQQYGSAGRGLVFPYQVAKTNSPDDLRSQSNYAAWEIQRNVMRAPHAVPVGLCGMSVQCSSPNFCLSLGLKAGEGFDKVTVLGMRGSDIYDLEVAKGWDMPLESPGKFVLMSDRASEYSASIEFDELVSELTFIGRKTEPEQKRFVLQGLILENTRSRGVLYNAAGVNGAMYASYNQSQHFYKEVAEIRPDLVIISLGTNEAYSASFATEYFEKNIDEMLLRLRKESGVKNILLTTPNDLGAPRRGRSKSTSVSTRNGRYAADILISKAKEHGVAVWDFYAVMGGFGSIHRWAAQKLAQHDKVHLSPQGYYLQAELLFKALQADLERDF